MGAPIKHTCPDIDKVIAAIRSAMKRAEYGMKGLSKQDEAYDTFREIEYVLDGEDNRLEELRKSNDILRKWGNELEEENNSLQNYIEELEKKLQAINTNSL